MIELFCGMFGWSCGAIEDGWYAVGFDIEHAPYHGEVPKGADLVLQDVLTLDGRQFKDADLILCSPPCQEFSFMAMPFSRGKKIAAALRGQGEFPDGYKGSRTTAELTALFDACFRIQREACAAAGRHIPMIVENVRGTQPWVGRAKANYGSFYLWGDVETVGDRIYGAGRLAEGLRAPVRLIPSPSFHGAEHEPSVANAMEVAAGRKIPQYSDPRRNGGKSAHLTNPRENEDGLKQGGDWFSENAGPSISSLARKAASAQIAKIPYPLSSFIARTFRP